MILEKFFYTLFDLIPNFEHKSGHRFQTWAQTTELHFFMAGHNGVYMRYFEEMDPLDNFIFNSFDTVLWRKVLRSFGENLNDVQMVKR